MNSLPKTSMTATILPATGRAPRIVVIHGSRGWQRKVGMPKGKRVWLCSACDNPGHNSRSKFCPARGVA